MGLTLLLLLLSGFIFVLHYVGSICTERKSIVAASWTAATIVARAKIKNKFMRFYLCVARQKFANHTPPVLMKMDFYVANEFASCRTIAYNLGTDAKTFEHYSSDDVRCPAIHCINSIVLASTDMSSHSLWSDLRKFHLGAQALNDNSSYMP